VTEFEPLLCYFIAINEVLKYGHWSPDYNLWFGGTCGQSLADACESGQPLGFNEETQLTNIQQFCSYHQCAYGPYLSNETSTVDFHACLCLLPLFFEDFESETNVYSVFTNADYAECCDANLPGESSIFTSCTCYMIPMCEDGNAEMCIAASNHCCANDEVECKRSYIEVGCNKSLIPLCKEGETNMCALAADYCCVEGDELSQDNCKRDYLKEGCDISIQLNQNITIPASNCCLDGDVNCIQHYLNIACESDLGNDAFNPSDNCEKAVEVLYVNVTNREEGSCVCNFWEQKMQFISW
jgi:hypothetical protein